MTVKTIGQLDREAKRELLWDRWADVSPTQEADTQSHRTTIPAEESVHPKSVIQWKLKNGAPATDESQDGCGCW